MVRMDNDLQCDLSIIIVSWNVWPLLEQCLRSIEHASSGLAGEPFLRQFPIPPTPQAPTASQATLEVIVVDNASSDHTPAHVTAHFSWVRMIASERNLGFTGGNNCGYAASRGRFVYFLNPDTEVGTRSTGWRTEETSEWTMGNCQVPIADRPSTASPLTPLFTALAADPSIGIVGPELRYGDGAAQASARRFPTPWTGFFESTWLGRAWPANPWARAMLMADRPHAMQGDVDWLVGAALCCRRAALASIATAAGPFDESFFMYSEELDLCRRAKLAGWRVVYEPAALVIHHEGKSSEQVATQRHIRFNTSKVRYWHKWFGPVWAEALRRYLLLEYCVQLWVEQVKLQLGHKPELRRARIATYQAVLASGLRPARN